MRGHQLAPRGRTSCVSSTHGAAVALARPRRCRRPSRARGAGRGDVARVVLQLGGSVAALNGPTERDRAAVVDATASDESPSSSSSACSSSASSADLQVVEDVVA